MEDIIEAAVEVIGDIISDTVGERVEKRSRLTAFQRFWLGLGAAVLCGLLIYGICQLVL